MKLYIDVVKRGRLKGQLFYTLIGDNGEKIIGLRPETMHNRADLEHNIDLVSRIREAEVVDLTQKEAS